MTSNGPLISVIMPVHNAGFFLKEAVESILNQKNVLFELIIVNDHSTDSAINNLPQYIKKDRRIKFITSSGRGVVAAMKTGVNLSQGQYIARMDADDITLPHRLSAQLVYLQQHPDIGIAGGQVKIISAARVDEGFQLYEKWLNQLCQPDDINREIFIESPVPNPTAFFRREVYEQLDGYHDPEWAEDYDIWLRAYIAGIKMAKPEGVLLHWREHKNRLTHCDKRYDNKLFMKAKAFYLSHSHHLRDRKAIIWGTGPLAIYLHDILLENNATVDAFLEVNPKRIGGEKRGLPVYHYDAASQYTNVLIISAVGSRGARREIRQALINMGKKEGMDFLFAA